MLLFNYFVIDVHLSALDFIIFRTILLMYQIFTIYWKNGKDALESGINVPLSFDLVLARRRGKCQSFVQKNVHDISRRLLIISSLHIASMRYHGLVVQFMEEWTTWKLNLLFTKLKTTFWNWIGDEYIIGLHMKEFYQVKAMIAGCASDLALRCSHQRLVWKIWKQEHHKATKGR